mmetsp:Transcript_4798/g.10735  ORF Transcript_4798/g.10735 Transcript_4798/m.10735 type:complete len:83 (-) Transcript_4798:315-563(-)
MKQRLLRFFQRPKNRSNTATKPTHTNRSKSNEPKIPPERVTKITHSLLAPTILSQTRNLTNSDYFRPIAIFFHSKKILLILQ